MGGPEKGRPVAVTTDPSSTEVAVNKLPEVHPIKGRRLLTIAQVCRLCSVSRRTVYYWIDSHKVSAAKGFGRRYIYADSIPLLQDYIATNEDGV